MASKYSNMTFMGYRRENGRVGVRNHVIILPVDDISNAACEAVANNVKGTMAIPHAYGRLQFGEDLEVHFRTIIGTGANPNVAAVVVIGIEPGWTKRIADGIRKTGKPVAEFSIEQKGDFETIRAAGWKAKEFVHYATEMQREECSISELWVSTKCGESDTTTGLSSCPTVGNMYDKLLPEGITGFFGETSEITGAEHICQKRAINEEVGERWYKMWKAYQDEVIFAHQTDDFSDSQPTKGNIEGGLTTIEEKALGNLEKIGRTSQFIDILDPAEQPAFGQRLVLHGFVLGGGGMRDADGGGRCGDPHLPHRSGQRGRQSDRAGDQDLGQSAHAQDHGRAYRCRRHRRADPRNDHRRGRRRIDRDDRAHLQRTRNRSRSPRSPRILND
jgi:(2R)-sulfolactate sulfo-lyase subunit beta